MASRVTVLDDYQGVALDSADWSAVRATHEIDVVREHLADPDELVARIGESDIVFCMRERTALPGSVLERLPTLKLIVTTGMQNAAIDVEAARARGITVCGTSGSGREVAELAVGMMIALARHVPAENAALHDGGWQHTVGTRLEGKTLGLIGLGKQGIWLAELALAFRMEVLAWSPHLTTDRAASHGATAVPFERIFTDSDFVSINVPLNDATRGLVGAEELAVMKETAYLINTSRGPIVDAEALTMALMVDTIAGAALDVYDIEPLPVADPLRSLPNALLMPHSGYVVEEVYAQFFQEGVDDIVAFLDGDPIRTL